MSNVPIGSESIASPIDAGLGGDHLPREVLSLFRREREIATIIYERGLATAKDVEAALGYSVRNAAVRSMLGRLVRKQILTQVKCGHHGTFVYGPAITQTSARETALRQFAEDYYGGSLRAVSDAIATMFITTRDSSDHSDSEAKPVRAPEKADRMMIAARDQIARSASARAAHQRT